jgi:hypothetical protein
MPEKRRQDDMKKILALIVAAAFIFSVTSFSLAAYEFYRGTITKISGDKVTVKDDKGKFRTIIIGGATDLKVGDKVSVENGKIIKGSGGTSLSPNPNPQPKPPTKSSHDPSWPATASSPTPK